MRVLAEIAGYSEQVELDWQRVPGDVSRRLGRSHQFPSLGCPRLGRIESTSSFIDTQSFCR